MRLDPSDVFVPGRFPIEKHNVYADRGKPQRLLETAWKRNFIPIVFGSYGVGKSSLAMFCARALGAHNKLVYIESVYGKSLADIFQRILEFIGYEVTVERLQRTEFEASTEVGFAVEGGILAALKARLAGKISRKRKKLLGDRIEVLIKSPTDSKILDLCEDNKIMLIIDELHRASDSFRNELSAFLKAFANRNAKHFTIGLLGTEVDASRLITRDPGVDRILQEISVSPISDEEAANIIYPGMERLEIDVPDEVAARVIRAGVGSPFVVQYLCLEMAERAREEGVSSLTHTMFRHALNAYAQAKAQRMIRSYRASIETTGVKRYRKQILKAMARSADDYVTMEKLVALVSEQLGESVPSTALSGPLRQLKSEECGKILADVEALGGGGRLYNYSVFADPAMKSVIRMLEELEEDEIPIELDF